MGVVFFFFFSMNIGHLEGLFQSTLHYRYCLFFQMSEYSCGFCSMLQKKWAVYINIYVFISSITIAILLSWLGDLKLPLFMEVHTFFDGTMFPVEHNFEVDVMGRFLVAGKTGP